jgi:hypothetical protein
VTVESCIHERKMWEKVIVFYFCGYQSH